MALTQCGLDLSMFLVIIMGCSEAGDPNLLSRVWPGRCRGCDGGGPAPGLATGGRSWLLILAWHITLQPEAHRHRGAGAWGHGCKGAWGHGWCRASLQVCRYDVQDWWLLQHWAEGSAEGAEYQFPEAAWALHEGPT